MREVLHYIRDYARNEDKLIILLCTVQTALLIFLNYTCNLESWLTHLAVFPWPAFTGHFLIFIVAFALPYTYYSVRKKKNYFNNLAFTIFLILACGIFSLKMSLNTELPFSNDPFYNNFWNRVYYWPVRLVLVFSILVILWQIFDKQRPFYGLSIKNSSNKQEGFNWRPYFLMLLIMMPLITLASTQTDFLEMYPKINSSLPGSAERLSLLHKILFELSYGSDFFTIEIFFRGFLILGFIKWVGKDAILPMACFYCTIHFGKPLAECISSYFGGMLLGIIVYNTGTIWGGLIVHLGIAWLMEIGGYIGNSMP